VEKLLLDNLRENQAFDAALHTGAGIDAIAAKLLKNVMFQADADIRAAAIRQLERQTVDYFKNAVQPAARKLAQRNAQRVLKATPELRAADALDSADVRRKILVEGNFRPATRLKIVQALVNDRANTLENRLTAYWLEPGAGDKAKLQHLREINAAMDERQQKYSAEMSDWLERGQSGSRPRKPQTDFLPRFQQDVKQDFREQARRAGTDAETSTFVKAGHNVLAWVTVNASEACPDCKKRNGWKATVSDWESLGKPGSGKTVCGVSCFCMLVPASAVTANPALAEKGLVIPPPGGVPSVAAKRPAA